MKTISRFSFLRSALLFVAACGVSALAAESKSACCQDKKACCQPGAACCQADGPAVTKTAASTNASYPLTTCVVTDEKLGEMGQPFEYVHREAGKPDRTILLCCKHCVKDFKKDPAKYLKILDDAEAKAKGRS